VDDEGKMPSCTAMKGQGRSHATYHTSKHSQQH
jgi:hypothetical protein